MFEFVKDIFRKSSLKKHASTVPTGILPLSQIKSYVAIIDVEDTTYDTCKSAILNYFRSMDIRGSVFFQDFRKIGSEDRLITSIQTTITKKDLDWLGRPNKYKLGVLDEQNPDLFISLIKEPDFAIEYMTKTSKARFKIGRKQMDGNLFDLVINDPAGKDISQLESWGAIKNYLGKIR
ncbi:MAG: hypothetical protein II632_05430 [Bacteroidales bacterium]|jgi:hypothetical protein|nr:hypothetical protein [Bacteroidales bacterium]MBQ5978790.1 hypothetical protein [Bacteroidales bacterium]MBQ6184344.1 hypothetical protein [Bacteroidales bacterium]